MPLETAFRLVQTMVKHCERPIITTTNLILYSATDAKFNIFMHTGQVVMQCTLCQRSLYILATTSSNLGKRGKDSVASAITWSNFHKCHAPRNSLKLEP